MSLAIALLNNFNIMKKIALLVLLTGTICFGQAQLLHLEKWNLTDVGWPVQTTIGLTRSKHYPTKSKNEEPKSLSNYEYAFKLQVHYFGHELVFRQTISLNTTTEIM
jgi:hypothetical protein